MKDELLSVQDVAALTGLPAETIRTYKWRGEMPVPDQYFGRSPAWRRSKVEKWMQSRKPQERS